MAAARNDGILLQKYLDAGVRPNEAWPDGITGLHIAAKHGYCDIARILLGREADVNQRDNQGCTPLWYACHRNQTDFVSFLLNTNSEADIGLKLDIGDIYGKTPLHIVAGCGFGDIVTNLLQFGYPIDVKTSEGYEALHLAAMKGEAGIIRILVDHKADVNAITSDGSTAIALAARGGHSNTVRTLISLKADFEAENRIGMRPLHEACTENHKEVIEILLQNGVRTDVASFNGQMPCCMSTDLMCKFLLHSSTPQPNTTVIDVYNWKSVRLIELT